MPSTHEVPSSRGAVAAQEYAAKVRPSNTGRIRPTARRTTAIRRRYRPRLSESCRSPGGRANALQMPAEVRQDDPADEALDVEAMLLVGQREPVKALVVEAAELAHEARPALVQLATNKSLRGETARRDARVERVRRVPVERERRIPAQRERDEARLPAQADRDVQGGDGDRPAVALTAAIPGVN